MRLLPVILIGCLFGLFLFVAILFILHRRRNSRKQRRQHQASVPDDEQPVSKFVIRKGRAVDVSQMSRPPSIISRHSSARNRMSVYSKLSHGIRNSNNSPCGSPRYWPVSMYSTHSQRHMHWSQRQSTLSGHRHPLPSSSDEAQNKGQRNESKDSLPRVVEGSPHLVGDFIAGSHLMKKWDSSFTKVNSNSSAKSTQGAFDGTVTPSVEVEIALGKPAKANPTSELRPPTSLGESSSLAAADTGQTTSKDPPMPAPQDGTDTSGFTTCGHDDDSHARNFKFHTEARSNECFGFATLSSTTRPWSSLVPSETKHNRPRESISSMRTFDSDLSDVYTVGHATSVMLPADPSMSPLARPPTLNRPISKYSVPVENRYAKALPSLPPLSPVLKRSEVSSSRSYDGSRPKTIDVVNLERKSGSRPPNLHRKKSAPGPREVRDTGGGIDGVDAPYGNLPQ